MRSLAGVSLQSGVLGLYRTVTETGRQAPSKATAPGKGTQEAKMQGPEDITAWYGQEKK